jgi:hypothetical protein
LFFSGAAGCAVPSLSQVQVELLKVKVSQQFVFSGAAGCAPSIPSTSRGVESVHPNSSLLLAQ